MWAGRVNIHGVELGARLDEAGFRHAAAAVGERLGARRIGAAVYEADAGFPISSASRPATSAPTR